MNISYSYIPDMGWTGKSFRISHSPAAIEDISLTLHPYGAPEQSVGIISAVSEDGIIAIECEEFNYKADWVLSVGGDTYRRKDMDDEVVEGLDVFEKKKDGNVVYGVYSVKV